MEELHYNWTRINDSYDNKYVYKATNIQFYNLESNALLILHIGAGNTSKHKMAVVLCIIEGHYENAGMTKSHFRFIGYDSENILKSIEFDDYFKQTGLCENRDKIDMCYLQYLFVDKLPEINDIMIRDYSWDNYIIHVDFENGVSKEYDFQTLISDFKEFESLIQVNGLFEQVKVDVGGYGVSWNDELDLSCNELYANGVSINKMI